MIPACRAADIILCMRALEYACRLAFSSAVKSRYDFLGIVSTSFLYSQPYDTAGVAANVRLRTPPKLLYASNDSNHFSQFCLNYMTRTTSTYAHQNRKVFGVVQDFSKVRGSLHIMKESL